MLPWVIVSSTKPTRVNNNKKNIIIPTGLYCICFVTLSYICSFDARLTEQSHSGSHNRTYVLTLLSIKIKFTEN